jgi:hypothetical protein
MPHYRVMLHGTGIHVPGNSGAPPIIGFYTTRVVRASSEAEAAHAAKSVVTAQWQSGEYAESNTGGLPQLRIESVARTGFFRGMLFRNGGHTFYSAE